MKICQRSQPEEEAPKAGRENQPRDGHPPQQTQTKKQAHSEKQTRNKQRRKDNDEVEGSTGSSSEEDTE